MDGEFWFEEPLIGSSQEASLESTPPGIVRMYLPRWALLTGQNIPLASAQNHKFLIIKLGFEIELPRNRENLATTFARCEAYIYSTTNKPQPLVYDMYPKELYEGEPQKISLKLGPQLTIGDYGASLGELGTDIMFGHLTPSIMGWKGKNEQMPYWEFRPISRKLLGAQYLWLVVEISEGCKEFRLSTRVYADIQTQFAFFSIGPKEQAWGSRPNIKISV